MRRREDDERELSRSVPARTDPSDAAPSVGPAALLELQRSAGNAAVSRLLRGPVELSQPSQPTLQRGLLDLIPNPFDPLGSAFEVVSQTNKAGASRIAVPARYRRKLLEYARANPADGALLLPGLLLTRPNYYSGGWILDVQTGAIAMTLDDAVFVRGDLDIGTYVHEMVHVTQYRLLGRTRFLVSYFGLSAAEIARRFIMREPINMMRSSPHENQAYDLEHRFLAWLAKNGS